MSKTLFDDKVEKSGLKFGFIAEKLNISRCALSRKRNGEIPWKVPEINILTDMLDLTMDERDVIFHLKSPQK